MAGKQRITPNLWFDSFNEATSFVIDCDGQEEVDYYWNKLTAGGDPKAQQCGWLKDRYGLSWQVVPKQLNEMIQSSDAKKAERLFQAMLNMKKIEVAALKRAYDGK